MEKEQGKIKGLDPELRFFIQCSRAISEQRYRDALEIIRAGLDELIGKNTWVKSDDLMMCLYSVIQELESTLKKAYGSDWQERIGIPEIPEEREILRCSFCGKAQYDVGKLIAGPNAYICNECVEICNEIIAEAKEIGR